MNRKYINILDKPHHISKTRKPMTMDKRAAQFAPFAALTGYEDRIKETERITSKKIELDEEQINKINETLNILYTLSNPHISITYYQKDIKKEGGKYFDKEIILHQIDIPNKVIITINKDKISFDDIYDIKILDN